jgi:hypothetical protein
MLLNSIVDENNRNSEHNMNSTCNSNNIIYILYILRNIKKYCH